MKYRAGSYTRIINRKKEIYHCVEYNDTDSNYEEDWFELEEPTEEMVKDIVKLLNNKYSRSPYYKYKKS